MHKKRNLISYEEVTVNNGGGGGAINERGIPFKAGIATKGIRVSGLTGL